MMGVPVQCSFLLVNDGPKLKNAHTTKADYLLYDNDGFDLASSILGCGRRCDSLKLFITWMCLGKKVRHNLRLAEGNFLVDYAAGIIGDMIRFVSNPDLSEDSQIRQIYTQSDTI